MQKKFHNPDLEKNMYPTTKRSKSRLWLVMSIWGVLLGSFQAAPPSDILSPEKLSHVFVDLILAEELVNYYSDNEETTEKLLAKNKLKVYELHGTDASAIEKSWQYYLEQPEIAQTIYQQVIEQLEAFQP